MQKRLRRLTSPCWVYVPSRRRQRAFPAFLGVLGRHVRVDAAANVEDSGQAHEARLGRFNQFVENLVGHGFVEAAFIAEAPDVHFERLQFHARFFGDVLKIQRAEIRLTGFRTEAGELGDAHADGEIALRGRVGEGFECLAGLGAHGGLCFK